MSVIELNMKANGTMSTSCSSTSIPTGEKHNMKQFIAAAQEYNRTKAEDTASLLSRYLQLLGVTLDLNTFDPHSSVVSEFFVSLHELMSGLESRSNLVWCGVSVLQQACKNPAAHSALIHTYQYLPILSRLLGDHLTREKKRKLLTLMQELTYGISISWQVAHLPHLIGTLTRWVEQDEEPVVSLSLGVLLNLCYRNLPVVYTLMRTVNTKHFLRTVMAAKSPATELQVCKLLITLEHINGEVPREDVLNFIRVTFKTVVEAFRSKDLIRLRHIVEFFLDVRNRSNGTETVQLYNGYATDVSRVLDAVETCRAELTGAGPQSAVDSTDLECVALLFEFLQSLVELNIDELKPSYPRAAASALAWVQTELVCSRALALLKAVAFADNRYCVGDGCNATPSVPPADASPVNDVLEPLAAGLPVFVHMLQNEEAQTVTYVEHCRKMGALLQLLRALVRCEATRVKLLATLRQEPIKRVLACMLGNDELYKGTDTRPSQFSPADGVELCVHALVLLCELAQLDEDWRKLYQDYIGQRQVHVVLAQAFYMNSTEMKKLVLEAARFKEFPTGRMACVMSELQPIAELTGTSSSVGTFGCRSTTSGTPSCCSVSSGSAGSHAFAFGGDACYPIMSASQADHLDQAIERFKEAVSNGQVASVATSEVMELYDYKMASMMHAERAAHASLEAATQQATHLQHRVAQLSTEVARLHQLLFHTQQCHEETQRQLRSSDENVRKLTARVTKEEVRYKEAEMRIAERDQQLERQTCTLAALEAKHHELVQAKKALAKKCEDQAEKNKTLVRGAEKLEETVKLLQKELREKTDALNKCLQRTEQMSKEIVELEELRRQHERLLSCKERELADTLRELAERKKILETITKLTTS